MPQAWESILTIADGEGIRYALCLSHSDMKGSLPEPGHPSPMLRRIDLPMKLDVFRPMKYWSWWPLLMGAGLEQLGEAWFETLRTFGLNGCGKRNFLVSTAFKAGRQERMSQFKSARCFGTRNHVTDRVGQTKVELKCMEKWPA